MNTTITVVCYQSKTLKNGEHPLMLRICKETRRNIKFINKTKNTVQALTCNEKGDNELLSPFSLHVNAQFHRTMIGTIDVRMNLGIYQLFIQ